MSKEVNYENSDDLTLHNKNPLLIELVKAIKARKTKETEIELTPQKLADLLHRDVKTLYKSAGGFPSKGSPTLLKIDRVAEFYFVLKFRPENFLLSPEDEKIAIKELKRKGENINKYFTRDLWQQISAYWPKKQIWKYSRGFDHSHRIINEKLDEAYQYVAQEYFRKAERSIFVHELLFKGNNEKPTGKSAYREAQKLIFKAIEKRLEEKHENFTYERIYHLSPSKRLFDKDSRDSKLWAFIAETSPESLCHIIRCLHRYESQCNFYYILGKTSLRQHVIIDDKDLLFEDYMIREDYTTPERLTVYDVSPKSDAHDLLKFYETSSQNYESGLVPVTLDSLVDGLESITKYLEHQQEIRAKAINLFKENGEKNKEEDFKSLKRAMESTQRKFKNAIGNIQKKKQIIGKEVGKYLT